MSEDRSWELPENQATDPKFAIRRRRFFQLLALGGAGLAGYGGYQWYKGTDRAILGTNAGDAALHLPPYSVTREVGFPLDRPATRLAEVGRYNNFYEFSPRKVGLWRYASRIPIRPWTITVDGLCHRPTTFDIDQLESMFGLEQRVYRHRCVEAWAMVVPWNGFSLRRLLDKVEPKGEAKYVRFVTADMEKLTSIPSPAGFPWPYQEALTIQEATNELAFLATGFYGERLFRQNGAPIRLVVPWKYGFKSAKSIARIELTDQRPSTFWNAAVPEEYGFFANVDPNVDHPRWSQKTEWMIDTYAEFPTQPYNGYGPWVGHLYKGNEV